MGFMDEFKKWARLDIEDEEDEEFEEFAPAKNERVDTIPQAEKRSNKVVNIHTTTLNLQIKRPHAVYSIF